MIASPPAARTGAAIRSSSVATTTRDKDFAFDACRQTRTTIGTPSISASAFAGKREDPYRAGTTAITETSARNFLQCKRFAIRGAHQKVPNRNPPCQFHAAISTKIYPPQAIFLTSKKMGGYILAAHLESSDFRIYFPRILVLRIFLNLDLA
jgi:hypothetical protein